MSDFTINSHYLPRCYLNKFTENRTMYCYDYNTEHYYPKGTKGECFVKYYYEIPGVPVNKIEKILSKIEKDGQDCLNKVENGTADNSDRVLSLQYMSSFRLRSPLFRSLQKEICRDQLKITDPYEIENKIRLRLYFNLNSCLFQLFDHPIKALDIVAIKWTSDVLITSDNPVIQCSLNDIMRNKIGLNPILFLLPLSPNTLMIAYHKQDISIIQNIIINNLENIDPTLIRKIIAENAISKLFFMNKSDLINLAGTIIDRHEIYIKAAESLKEDIQFADDYWKRIKNDVPRALFQ